MILFGSKSSFRIVAGENRGLLLFLEGGRCEEEKRV